jgi:hypothetical protein
MSEQNHNRVLRDAARCFPEGCLCDDSGECSYCRFILICWGKRNRTCASPCEKRDDDVFPDNLQFKIPVGSPAQIYELRVRRVFRLCN